MAQSVVIGLPSTVLVGNDTPIAIVLYFKRSIENINIYYISYLQVMILWSQLVQINWGLSHLSRASVCESRVELSEIREAVVSKMTGIQKKIGVVLLLYNRKINFNHWFFAANKFTFHNVFLTWCLPHEKDTMFEGGSSCSRMANVEHRRALCKCVTPWVGFELLMTYLGCSESIISFGRQ